MIKDVQRRSVRKAPCGTTLFIWLDPSLYRETPLRLLPRVRGSIVDTCMRHGEIVATCLYQAYSLLRRRKGRDNLGRLKGRGYDLSHLTDMEGHDQIWMGTGPPRSGKSFMKVFVRGESMVVLTFPRARCLQCRLLPLMDVAFTV